MDDEPFASPRFRADPPALLRVDVACIVTGTCAPSDASWDFLLSQYAASYWRADADRGVMIANRLRETGRDAPNVGVKGIWLEVP